MNDNLEQGSPSLKVAPRPGSQARPGRPVGDRDAKRTELLDAALETIAEEGYPGTSLRKVARRAGHTTGAVIYYFENKEAMVVAVAEHAFDIFDRLMDEHDIRQVYVRGLTWSDPRHCMVWLTVFQLLAVARHEKAIARVFAKRYARFRMAFAAMIEEAQREGTVRNDIPADILADQLNAIGDGWMLLRPIEKKRFAKKRIEELLAGLLKLITLPPRQAA